MNIFNLTPEQKAERNRLARRNLLFFAIFVAALWFFGNWYIGPRRASTPTRDQRAESWRQQKLEDSRVKNYIENIKPYVPK